MNIFDILTQRNIVKQATGPEQLRQLLDSGPITFYIGFDPTAPSLHIGHLVQLITAKRLIEAGHKAIILIGGATALIGDPSGKSDMRKMLSHSDITEHSKIFEKQITSVLNTQVQFVNNLSWFSEFRFLDFLREVGPLFSVNHMLRAECFKARMKQGLSFLELNYMIMQAQDFFVLNEKENCVLQIGGDDQWSNILAGIDLIHKKIKKESFGLTLPLLLNSNGQKMGKTENGAVWLDPNKVSPFEFFQFWRNVPDNDVENLFQLLTFLEPKDWQKKEINDAKKKLAFEITRTVHGETLAREAIVQAENVFERKDISVLETILVANQISLTDLVVQSGFAKSKTEARNLIINRGISINNEICENINEIIQSEKLGKEFLLKKGKKNFKKIILLHVK